MTLVCPLCGLTLIIKDRRKICPNHGIVESSEESDERDKDYIG